MMIELLIIGLAGMLLAAGPGKTETSGPAAAPQGQTVMLDFLSNPTTGYTWSYAQEPELFEIRQEYVEGDPGESTAVMVGVGGEEIFELVPVKAGEATVTFTYGQAWDPTTAGNYVYTFEIGEDLSVVCTGVTEPEEPEIGSWQDAPEPIID
ncbi:MAG: protease inhibitor I42 family protein [Blautia sp.]|nr:protease inhibitor I42 family protein [Blautia sp.]